MKVTYKVNENVSLEFEAANQLEVFAGLAQYGEIFSISECGSCKSDNLRHVVREVVDGKKTYTFYELRCNKCFHKLTFGQKADGSNTLFPHRKDDKGNYLPNGGWTKYEKPKESE